MEQANESARIDLELKQAQTDLRDTLNLVNHKVERVEARLRPKAIIRTNPVALSLLAGVLGYFAGSERAPRPLRWVVLGALLGAALAASHQGSDNGSKRTNG
jgi:hypothetical protein